MLPAVALAVPCKHRGWLDTLLFPDPVDVHVDSPESACTSNSSRDGTEQLVHPSPIPAAPPNSTQTSTRPHIHPHAHTWPTRPHPLASLEPHTPGRRWCEVHPLHRATAAVQVFSDGSALPTSGVAALAILTAISLLVLCAHYSRCRTAARSRWLTMATVDPDFTPTLTSEMSAVRQAPARFKLPLPYLTGVSRYTLPSPYRAVQG